MLLVGEFQKLHQRIGRRFGLLPGAAAFGPVLFQIALQRQVRENAQILKEVPDALEGAGTAGVCVGGGGTITAIAVPVLQKLRQPLLI